jgi:hypothetical protein
MANDKVYINRLLKLADFLMTVPKERFDFGSWVGEDWKGKPNLSCGTTACALGWATTIPLLRKAGLMLKFTPDEYSSVTLKHNPNTSSEYAGMEVFGLTLDEFEYLFTSYGCLWKDDFSYLIKNKKSLGRKATAQQVAARIKEFVEDKYFMRQRALAKLTAFEKKLLGVEI